MGYILFHIGTYSRIKYYTTERGAKIGRAASNRNAGKYAYDILEETVFNAAFNKKTTVKSLQSGQDVEINQQDVGGPCDPSTERYWSM